MTMLTPVATASPPISEEELIRLADQGFEYAGGRVVEKTMSIGASEVEVTVGALLHVEASNTGESKVFSQSLNYRCYADEPAKFRKPDVSVIRMERLKGTHPDDGFVHFPADLVVEVLSPTDLAVDVAKKVEDYLTNGFPLVWIVNPNTRTVTIHRANGSIALLHEADEITGESALPALRCKVGAFFVGSASDRSPLL